MTKENTDLMMVLRQDKNCSVKCQEGNPVVKQGSRDAKFGGVFPANGQDNLIKVNSIETK